jgi:hypothetical protein
MPSSQAAICFVRTGRDATLYDDFEHADAGTRTVKLSLPGGDRRCGPFRERYA